MKRIPLTRGKFALVDDEDFAPLTKWPWHVHGRYAARMSRVSEEGRPLRVILMHRQIMGEPEEWVDHRDRDGFNNRRKNLRVCNGSESNQNKGRRKSNRSGVKGVSRNRNRGSNAINYPYRARIFFAGKEKNLGFFASKEEAGRAYDDAARKYFGEFAYCQ